MIKSPSKVFSEFGVSADEMRQALNSSFLTINEKREMFGLNPVSIEESIFKSGGPSGSRDSGVKQMTIRRAVSVNGRYIPRGRFARFGSGRTIYF